MKDEHLLYNTKTKSPGHEVRLENDDTQLTTFYSQIEIFKLLLDINTLEFILISEQSEVYSQIEARK